jgi:hypothetical protein
MEPSMDINNVQTFQWNPLQVPLPSTPTVQDRQSTMVYRAARRSPLVKKIAKVYKFPAPIIQDRRLQAELQAGLEETASLHASNINLSNKVVALTEQIQRVPKWGPRSKCGP